MSRNRQKRQHRNADEKNGKDIAVQANEGEKDVESKTDLENALNDDNIHTINITGNIRYTDPLTTSKRIVVKTDQLSHGVLIRIHLMRLWKLKVELLLQSVHLILCQRLL